MIKQGSIYLDAIEDDDVPTLLEWRNMAEFRQFFREYREISLKQQYEWFDHMQKDPLTIMFAIRGTASKESSGNGLLLGAAGLTYIKWKDRQAELSLYIGDRGAYLDDKYAPDTLRALLYYGFMELGMHKLWAEVYNTDTKRIRLFERHEFSLDGTLRHNAYKQGIWLDSYIFSMLENQYISERYRWTE